MNISAALYSRLKLADKLSPFVNTVVTNVPGPPIPLYSAGAKLVGMFGQLCLVDGVRLGHVVHSYMGDITIGFVADRSAMPDPEFYAKCLTESFEEHLDAVKDYEKRGIKPAFKTAKTKSASPKGTSKPKTVKTTTVRTVKDSSNAPANGSAKPET